MCYPFLLTEIGGREAAGPSADSAVMMMAVSGKSTGACSPTVPRTRPLRSTGFWAHSSADWPGLAASVSGTLRAIEYTVSGSRPGSVNAPEGQTLALRCVDEDGPLLVCRHYAPQVHGGVWVIRMHAAAGVEEGPVGLVEVHPAAQRRQFLLREVRDVPFDAIVAKERGGSTEVKAVAAPRGVRGGPADVSSHQLVGHKESGVGLVVETFQRIYAVTCPDPVGPVQHGKVHACPAGGARLDFRRGDAP